MWPVRELHSVPPLSFDGDNDTVGIIFHLFLLPGRLEFAFDDFCSNPRNIDSGYGIRIDSPNLIRIDLLAQDFKLYLYRQVIRIDSIRMGDCV